MHSTDTKSKFLQLRAKGWSLARISKDIEVSVRTLVDWNRQHRDELQILRTVEIEALQEKLLATHEQELTALTEQLKRLEQEISKRHIDIISTENLFRLAAATRAQIRKLTIPTQSLDHAEKQP